MHIFSVFVFVCISEKEEEKDFCHFLFISSTLAWLIAFYRFDLFSGAAVV
jgi:hypothetical protein